MEHVTKAQQKSFSFKGLFQGIPTKAPSFLLAEEGICKTILCQKRYSPKGTEYQTGLFEDQKGQIGKFLICQEKWPDLSQTKYLEGQRVTFTVTENGLKLKPFDLQPLPTKEHIQNSLQESNTSLKEHSQGSGETKGLKKDGMSTAIEAIERVASVLTKKVAEEGIPMALGVFIPPIMSSEKTKN